jgi:hypothetical protein
MPVIAVAVLGLLTTAVASADGPGWTTVSNDFQGPIFGLATSPNGSLVVADDAGPTQLKNGQTSLVTELPFTTDVAPIGNGNMLVLAEGKLFSANKGRVAEIADIIAWEEANNPDNDTLESNPFDLARLNGHRTVVADAAGNSILHVDNKGGVDWIATLPEKVVDTTWLKDIVGCPSEDPEVAFICELPDEMPTDPVPTSAAIGPDGMIYVGELIGFPGTPGMSQIWRIDPNVRHVQCGTDPGCELVDAGPFTSIIDLTFGPDGTAYVVELDEASWLAAEEGLGVGGTVNACTDNGGSWTCTELATGLPFPTSVAVSGGNVYATLFGAIPGQAEVALLD